MLCPQPLTGGPCSGGNFCSRHSGGVPSSASIPRTENPGHMTDPDQRLKLGLAHVTFQRAGPARGLKVLVRVCRASAAVFPVDEEVSLSHLGGSVLYVYLLFEGIFTDLNSIATVFRGRSHELSSLCKKSSSKGSRSLCLSELWAFSPEIRQSLTKGFLTSKAI